MTTRKQPPTAEIMWRLNFAQGTYYGCAAIFQQVMKEGMNPSDFPERENTVGQNPNLKTRSKGHPRHIGKRLYDMADEIKTHPVQRRHHLEREKARAPQVVTLRAYEVYRHVFGPQEALITDGSCGGFGVSELIAFLYAHSFPQNEWRSRVDEALSGMEGL